MKWIKTITAVISLMSGVAYGQAGYLGALNNIDISFSGAPSLQRDIKLKEVGGDTAVVQPLRYLLPAFELTYSRVVAERIELSLGYGYTKMKSFSNNSYYNFPGTGGGGQVLESIGINRHSFHFDFKFYRKGSFAPVGKFIGFRINYGVSSITDESIQLGSVGSTRSESNFFRRVNALNWNSTFDLDPSRGETGSFFALRAFMGRNFPITNQLMLTTRASVAILSSYKTNAYRTFGFAIAGDDSGTITDDNFRQTHIIALHKYNRLQLKIGLNYNF